MKLNVLILLFFCVFGFLNLNAQTYNFSYTDPCTGNLKTIVVPINGNVTVSYYGEIGSFSYNDFSNGTFDTWTNNIFSQYGTNSPCSEIVGLGTAVNVTQGTALNVIGILNSLSSISDLASGSTNILGGSVSSISNGSGENNSNNNKKGNNSQNGSGTNTTNNNNSTTTNTNNSTTNNTQNQTNGTGNPTQGGTTTSGSNEGGTNGGNGTTNQNAGTENPTQAGGTTTQSGSNENGNQTTEPSVGGEGSGTEINNQTTTENGNTGNNGGIGTNGGNGNNGGSGNDTGNNQTQEGQGKTNITGGASTTVKSTPTSKEGGKPTVVGSGDFIGFNFKNSDVKTGLKLTGGYTAMRWDGKRSSGCLVDYTSALKGPNITGFYAFIRSKSIIIGSGTLTVGFEGNKSLYGTFAAGQMFTFKKPKSLKLLYMATVSYGNVYRESFLGTAAIVGGTYDIKAGKRIDIKVMNLFVYAPYVSYYNDVVLKSPYVMLPSIGTNIKITKKFKFNINAGGAWDLKTSALNYTVTCGARMLVGQ